MSAQVYSAKEIMPEQKDVEKVITAKLSYDKAKSEKTPQDFNTWINDQKNYFKCAPRGLAYSVSKKSYDNYVGTCMQNKWKVPKPYAPTALRYFIIAVAIGWDELVQALKVTLRYWGFTSADIQQYAQNVWLVPNNANAISQMIGQIPVNNLKLIEAVEKHSKLNTKLFTKDEVLKDRVRNKMLEIVDEFLADLKEQEVKIKVDDILLIGSNASYNYTKDSDIDLHILADAGATKYDSEVAAALYSAYRSLFNKQLDIKLFDIPLELFVETEGSPRVSNGVYSVKKNKWIKKPVHEEIPDYDTKALDDIVGKWEAKCKELVDDIKADKLADEKRVVKMLEDIYDKLRKKGIAKGEYSIENLAFKELRNKGYLDKLKEYRNELVSKRLSLEEKLDRQMRMKVYNQITRAAGTQPIIQDNGMFFIYNIKASEINSKVQALRKLPCVAEVHANENGKYDFSNTLEIAMNRIPSKYYDIRGMISSI